ncbi:MAG: hypothetical protein IJ071_06890 [Ruminococcus sp.]|nr:hypothetical protein [Ruminococcus sp.]
MAATKKTAKAAEAEVKAVAAPAEEKKTAAKKPAAKKAAAPKAAAEKKAPAKKTAAAEKKAPARKTAAKKAAATVYVQYLGAELTTEAIVAKAIADSGIASAKKVDVYVKPEENKVYYVIDGKEGSFFLV